MILLNLLRPANIPVAGGLHVQRVLRTGKFSRILLIRSKGTKQLIGVFIVKIG